MSDKSNHTLADLWNKKQVAREAGLSVRTIDRYRKKGLRSQKLGSKLVRFDPTEVRAFFGDRKE